MMLKPKPWYKKWREAMQAWRKKVDEPMKSVVEGIFFSACVFAIFWAFGKKIIFVLAPFFFVGLPLVTVFAIGLLVYRIWNGILGILDWIEKMIKNK